jgi:uncharacterized protein YutE (UPF0331/DUF86 family)
MGLERLIRNARRKLSYLKGRLARLRIYMDNAPARFVGAEVERYAVERLFTIVVQSAVDVGLLVLLARGYEQPDAATRSFTELAEQGVLDSELADRLRARVRERNRLIHLYDRMTADDVHKAARSALSDFPPFIEQIHMALVQLEGELHKNC